MQTLLGVLIAQISCAVDVQTHLFHAYTAYMNDDYDNANEPHQISIMFTELSTERILYTLCIIQYKEIY